MNISQQQTQKILTSKCKFNQLGFNMLVTRLTGLYARNPSEAVLTQCTDEINAFFAKYQSILQKDYEAISIL